MVSVVWKRIVYVFVLVEMYGISECPNVNVWYK